MAQRGRHSRHKRRPSFVRFLLKLAGWLMVFAVIIGVIWFAVTQLAKTQEDVMTALYPTEYSEYVDEAAEKYDLDKTLIYGVIKTESDFDEDAKSRVGALGLMQMMPETFDWLQEERGVEGTYTEEDLFTPEISIDYGCYFLRYLVDYYGNQRCAVAAYNAGFVVDDWLNDPNYSIDGITLTDIPYPETKAYVDKVFTAKSKYKELYFN